MKSNISLSLSSGLGHSFTVGFSELFFTSSIRISALNSKSWHYVTLSRPTVVPVQSVHFEKKRCPTCPGYPTCEGDTNRTPGLSRPPRQVRDPNVNGSLNFAKK